MNPICTTVDSYVCHITISRPEARNALDRDAVSMLLEAFASAESSGETRSILITAGGSIFSSGFEIAESLISSTIDDVRAQEALLTFGLRSSKPLVVAVQGAALGAGAVLCASAHVALAAQGTSFAITEIRAGQWPYTGWAALVRAIGHRRALELTLSGRVFSAQDALAWGIIHEITQPSELEDRAFATAFLLASAPPAIVTSALNWLKQPGDPCLAALENLQSPEAREGFEALIAKRRPVWPSDR